MLPPEIVEPPCSALGRDVSPAQGDDPVATCTVLLLPYTSADREQHLSTCNGHAQHHVITHIATLSGADPHADSDVLWHARPTGRHRTRTTDLLLVWNEPPACSWVEPESTPRWCSPARGVYRQRQEPAVDPSTHHHQPEVPRATGVGATKRFKQAPRAPPCTPHGTAWSTRSCPTVQPRPPCPGTHGTTSPSRTHHCVSAPGRHQTRHIGCLV
jgi:hypothetical protein